MSNKNKSKDDSEADANIEYMARVSNEFDAIQEAVTRMQDLFDELKLTPAEGVAALSIMRNKTIAGMSAEINFTNKSGVAMKYVKVEGDE